MLEKYVANLIFKHCFLHKCQECRRSKILNDVLNIFLRLFLGREASGQRIVDQKSLHTRKQSV